MATRLRIGLLCFVVFSPAAARAHLGSIKHIRVERTAEGARVRIDVEDVDASVELGLGLEPELAALEVRAPALHRWLGQGLTLRRGNVACEARVQGMESVVRDERRYLRFDASYRCPDQGAYVLRDDTVFPDDPQHEVFVTVAHAGDTAAVILRRGRQEAELALPTPGGLITTFLWEGVMHFVTGYDHVLFLLSLVLAAGFVARRRGLRSAARDVAWLVTAFTLGHSVTLIAAALGVVVLRAGPVEVAIALSIVVVALLNVIRPEERRAMPWLALGFGLVHGFGFSSVLSELGLPREDTVLALVAFNIGIELAQLAFVLAVLGPIAWLSRSKRYAAVVRGASLAITVLALVWVAERI